MAYTIPRAVRIEDILKKSLEVVQMAKNSGRLNSGLDQVNDILNSGVSESTAAKDIIDLVVAGANDTVKVRYEATE